MRGGRCKRGVILYPGGNIETTYVWGLGNPTNNQIEVYALFQGLF